MYGVRDQLRGELELKKLRLEPGRASGQHMTALWAWAAMVREGHFDGDFRAFREACIAFSDPQDDEEDEEDEDGQEVDPTQPAVSTGSASA